MYDDATFSGGGGGLGRPVPLDVGDIEKEGGPQGRVVRVDFGRHCPWILDEVELCFAHEHSIQLKAYFGCRVKPGCHAVWPCLLPRGEACKTVADK